MNIQDLNYTNILYSQIFSKILIAIIILLVGIIVGRIIGKIISRLLNEFGLNKALRKTTKIKASIEDIISNLAAYFIYLITIIMALNQLGLSTTVLNIIIIAIITIFIITLFFIIKSFFPNIIAAVFIQKKNIISEGETIKVGNSIGKVKSINLVETIIETKKGDTIYLPNSVLIKKEIIKLKVQNGKKQ